MDCCNQHLSFNFSGIFAPSPLISYPGRYHFNAEQVRPKCEVLQLMMSSNFSLCCAKYRQSLQVINRVIIYFVRRIIVPSPHDECLLIWCVFFSPSQSSASRASESGPKPETLHRVLGLVPEQPGLTRHQLPAVQRQTRSVSVFNQIYHLISIVCVYFLPFVS